MQLNKNNETSGATNGFSSRCCPVHIQVSPHQCQKPVQLTPRQKSATDSNISSVIRQRMGKVIAVLNVRHLCFNFKNHPKFLNTAAVYFKFGMVCLNLHSVYVRKCCFVVWKYGRSRHITCFFISFLFTGYGRYRHIIWFFMSFLFSVILQITFRLLRIYHWPFVSVFYYSKQPYRATLL